MRTVITRLSQSESLNFVLTNRIPRRALTRFMGWFSKIELPLVRELSIAVWRAFCDVDLSDAKKARFRSLHDCFVRELSDGARAIDPDPAVLVSPCDGIVGASGAIAGDLLLQVKGQPYRLGELLADEELVALHRYGRYVTLRLTAGMYHRFHAPHDCRVTQVDHIPGDAWNVNPPTLRRIAKLYCKNERAVLRLSLDAGAPLTLVAVAAVLVSGIRLRFLDLPALLGKGGNWRIAPHDARLAKGEEMGWFEHGSTIIVLAPDGFRLCDGVTTGTRVKMGAPLLLLP
jgi:phosphatidylserine decarboxylase